MLKEAIRETLTPKRRKLSKVDEMRTALNEATETFIAYQKEAEQRMRAFEKGRLEANRQVEDRRQKEDREHELVMFRLLAGMQSGQAAPHIQQMHNSSNTQPSHTYPHNDPSTSYFQL